MKNLRSAALLGVFGLTLAGCAVGPDFREPAPPQTTRYTETPLPPETVGAPGQGGAAQRFVPGGTIAEQWWTLFRSEPLDRLIRDAVAESPTLAAAQATLRQAKETYAAGSGALLYPGVDASLSANREKVPVVTPGTSSVGGGIFNLYNASVNVSYALDIFGRNRRELEGLQSQVDFRGFQLDGAYLTLTSNIVTTAVREASLRAQIGATREIIAAEERQLELVERQRQLGAVARLARARAKHAGRANARDAAAARARSRPQPAFARGAGRPAAERSGVAGVRARGADVAAGDARSACRPSSCASGPTSARPKRSCTRPARRSGSRRPISIRRSR